MTESASNPQGNTDRQGLYGGPGQKQNRSVANATSNKALQDILRGACNTNLANKNVYAGQNSLVHPATSTAGDYATNGVIITASASSTVYALQTQTVPAYGGVAYVCCLNAAGSGIGYKTNVLDSAAMSAASSVNAGTAPANLIAKNGLVTDIVWPEIPDTMTPVAIYAVVAGSVSHVSGSTTFSVVTSAGGSHAYTQLMNMNQMS